MRELMKQCVGFYTMLEYFTTRNYDDTSRLPSIPPKPFTELDEANDKVKSIINNKYFGDLNVNCVFLNKK